MKEEIVFRVVMSLVGLLVTLTTTFVIPYIVKKIGASNLEKLKTLADLAVRAAEQIYGPKTASQKKEYVIKFLRGKMGFMTKIGVTDDQLNTIIESAVYSVSSAIKTEVEQIEAAQVSQQLAITAPVEETPAEDAVKVDVPEPVVQVNKKEDKATNGIRLS